MRIVALVVLALFTPVDLFAQKATAKPSLEQTVTWMANFSAAHGFFIVGGVVKNWNRLEGVKGCGIMVERHFSKGNFEEYVKNEKADLSLGDFDPTKIAITADKQDGSYRLTFEHTDSANKFIADAELGDGTKTKLYLTQEDMFFDTASSAERFSRALSHAITLCGGVAAPY